MKEKVIKFIIVAIVAIFSASMACADTYHLNSTTIQGDNRYKYVFGSFGERIEIGLKLDSAMNIVPTTKHETDSVLKAKQAEEAKIKELKEKREKEELKQGFSKFADDLFKLGCTFLCIIATLFIVAILCGIIWLIFALWYRFNLKKD